LDSADSNSGSKSSLHIESRQQEYQTATIDTIAAWGQNLKLDVDSNSPQQHTLKLTWTVEERKS
jgi:hypothetical protein